MTETTKEQRDELRRLHAGVDSPVLATRSDALAAAIADAERLAEVEALLREEIGRIEVGLSGGATQLRRILDGGNQDE